MEIHTQLDEEHNPVVGPDGTQEWWVNGQRHRTDGPAVIFASGDCMWLQNGKLHRSDGPAIIYTNGTQEWYANGNYYREFDHWCKQLKLSREEIAFLKLKYAV